MFWVLFVQIEWFPRIQTSSHPLLNDNGMDRATKKGSIRVIDDFRTNDDTKGISVLLHQSIGRIEYLLVWKLCTQSLLVDSDINCILRRVQSSNFGENLAYGFWNVNFLMVQKNRYNFLSVE